MAGVASNIWLDDENDARVCVTSDKTRLDNEVAQMAVGMCRELANKKLAAFSNGPIHALTFKDGIRKQLTENRKWDIDQGGDRKSDARVRKYTLKETEKQTVKAYADRVEYELSDGGRRKAFGVEEGFALCVEKWSDASILGAYGREMCVATRATCPKAGLFGPRLRGIEWKTLFAAGNRVGGIFIPYSGWGMRIRFVFIL